jgi:hypothetical protein
MSCSETVPFSGSSKGPDLVVECELQTDSIVSATIYFAGNSSGEGPEYVTQTDSFQFYFGPASLGQGIQLVQDESNRKHFFLPPSLLDIESARSYRFSGKKAEENLFSSVLRIPPKVHIETLEGIIVRDENYPYQLLECSISLSGDPGFYPYLHISAKGTENESLSYVWDNNVFTYTLLKHRSGILVNNTSRPTNKFHFKLGLPENYSQDSISITIANVTDTYYYHNQYLSHNTSPLFHPQNPPIYPQNLKSENVRGVLSAAAVTQYFLKIK